MSDAPSEDEVRARRVALERIHAETKAAAPPLGHAAAGGAKPAAEAVPHFPHGPAPSTSPGDMGRVIGEGVKGAIAMADDKLEAMVKQGIAGVSHTLDRLIGGGGGEAGGGEGEAAAGGKAKGDKANEEERERGGKEGEGDSMEKVLLLSPSPVEPRAATPAEMAARRLRQHRAEAEAEEEEEEAGVTPIAGPGAAEQAQRERFLASPVPATGSPDTDEAAAERAAHHAKDLADAYFEAKAAQAHEGAAEEAAREEEEEGGGEGEPGRRPYHPTPSHMGRTWAPQGEPAGRGVGGGTGYPKSAEELPPHLKGKAPPPWSPPPPPPPPAGKGEEKKKNKGDKSAAAAVPPTAEAVATSLGAAVGASLLAAQRAAEGAAQAGGRLAGHAAAAPKTAAERAGYVSGVAVRHLVEDFVPALETEGAFDAAAAVHERDLEREEREGLGLAGDSASAAALRRAAAEAEARAARLQAEAERVGRAMGGGAGGDVARERSSGKDQQKQQPPLGKAAAASHGARERAAEAVDEGAHAAGLTVGHAADALSHALEAVGLGGDEPPPPAEIVKSTEEILAERRGG